MGISFGANIVYSGVAPLLVEREIRSEYASDLNTNSVTIGDGIFLLNPVIEASRFYDLEHFLAQHPQKAASCSIAIFTSKEDWANRKAFGIGQRIWGLFNLYASEEERVANTTSIGFYQPFITHDLKLTTPALRRFSVGFTNEIKSSSLNFTRTNKFAHCELLPRNDSSRSIVNVSVDPRIIPNHETIDRGIFIRFLMEFYAHIFELRAATAKLPFRIVIFAFGCATPAMLHMLDTLQNIGPQGTG